MIGLCPASVDTSESVTEERLKTHRSRAVEILGVLLVVAQIALLPAPRSDGHLLSSDGGYYYMYMRSALLDGDLDISNDVELYNARVPQESTARLHEWYVFSVGPGLLWSPFFLVGHAVARLSQTLGASVVPDGFSFLEEAFVVLGSVVYAAFALALLFRMTTRIIPNGLPSAAVVGTFLVSPAVYYAIFEPTMSHTLELFAASLFFWALLGHPLRGSRDYLLLGATAGLMFLVRWQNAVLICAAAPLAFGRAPFELQRPTLRCAIALLAGALPVVSLQLLFWKITLGSFVTVPQGGEFLTFSEPHFLEVLFSTQHGLLSWHPALALGLVGLTCLPFRFLAWSAVAAIGLDLFVCSIVSDWWGVDAFGMRRMVGGLPLLVLGCAGALSAVRTSRWRAWFLTSLLFFSIWNMAFMVQYRLGFISPRDALTFRELVIDKFLLAAKLIQRFFP